MEISEKDTRNLSTDKVFRKGERYHRDGGIRRIDRINDLVTAEIQGTCYSEINGYFIADYVVVNMNYLKLILKDTVVGQLWQGVSFYRDLGRTRLMGKAIVNSAIRNFVILGILCVTYQNSIWSSSIGLVFVAVGASLLAYVALRMRVNSLGFVERPTKRFASPSRRQSYFDVLNVFDSIFGFLYVVTGFSIRMRPPCHSAAHAFLVDAPLSMALN